MTFLFLFLELTACGTSDGELDGSSPLRPAVLVMTTTTSTTWRGFCHRVDVALTTSSNQATTAGRLRTVDISADLGSIYSDSRCSSAITSRTLSANEQGFTVYFRSTTVGTANLTASGSALTDASGTITVETASADISLGQQALNFNTANFPSLSAQSLFNPYNSAVANGKFFVSDTSNHRVLIWNSIPTSTQQAADLVLGQPNMTTNTCNTGSISAQTLCGPTFVHSDGTRLVVSDESNNRVLIWNSIPTSTQQAADLVLGQPNMTSAVDGSGSPSAINLAYPGGVFIHGSKLLVVDGGNNRVLIWNTFPTVTEQAADVVVGQAGMGTNGAGTSSTTLTYPYMVYASSSKMFVADYGNSRILIWNAVPTSNGAAASLVVGQPDFDTGGLNTGGLSASSLAEAAAPVIDAQGRFYVPDFSNNRILVWNQTPTSNNQAADAVIGQPDFTTNTQNNGGIGASSVYNPWGLFINDGILWIAEYGNHRVLKYTIPF